MKGRRGPPRSRRAPPRPHRPPPPALLVAGPGGAAGGMGVAARSRPHRCTGDFFHSPRGGRRAPHSVWPPAPHRPAGTPPPRRDPPRPAAAARGHGVPGQAGGCGCRFPPFAGSTGSEAAPRVPETHVRVPETRRHGTHRRPPAGCCHHQQPRSGPASHTSPVPPSSGVAEAGGHSCRHTPAGFTSTHTHTRGRPEHRRGPSAPPAPLPGPQPSDPPHGSSAHQLVQPAFCWWMPTHTPHAPGLGRGETLPPPPHQTHGAPHSAHTAPPQ